MAEQEVVKHTKKLFSVWMGNKGIWHKVGEFFLEIVIIVFAVSLSIYLHDNSEKKHQRHETKEFLMGLRQDLLTDTQEMREDITSFTNSGKAFTYITSIKLNEQANPDTIRKYSPWIFNTTGLIPNSGRYEGFKSAGKIGTIENKILQDHIMDLYQENIPNVISSTDAYTINKQRLFDYLALNRKRITDSTTNLADVLTSDPAYNISQGLVFVGEILSRYDTCIAKMQTIIDIIDKEYVAREHH